MVNAVMHALPLSHIFKTWWPLAVSWLFMGLEQPLVGAVIARLAEPTVNLAALGSVVFPIALIIEAPIIMLLAASTALSKDWASYEKLYRFMMWAGGLLTLLHILLVFTPLYDLVIVAALSPPQEVVGPARLGLMVILPWTWSIAHRRFHQGVLIRFGQSRAVSTGTLIRLCANILAMGIGVGVAVSAGNLPGIVVGALGIAAGVLTEMIYISWRVRPVLRELRNEPPAEDLTWPAFYNFYIPLAATSLLLLLVQPLGSAALGRMPRALESLAVWPILSGFIFVFRSLGMAYNEVVVALADEPGSLNGLCRFTWLLTGGIFGALLLIAATPLSTLWFENVAGLEPRLARLAQSGLWFALLWPSLSVLQNWYQGLIMHGKKTNSIVQSVALSLVVSALILVGGVLWEGVAGLYVGVAAFVVGSGVQVAWLWLKVQPVVAGLERRDAHRRVGRLEPQRR